MNPTGYHLANVLLHAVNAVLFYFIALRLLRASAPGRPADATSAPMLGAGCATLLFAVHPLRAESVAWITERRDVLSGLFYLAAIAAYLRYCDLPVRNGGQTRTSREWDCVSLGFFSLAFLSKGKAITFHNVFSVVDGFPRAA